MPQILTNTLLSFRKDGWNYLKFTSDICQTRKTATDQILRSDQPCLQYTCWTPLLATCLGIGSQPTTSKWKPTTAAINQYSLDAAADCPVAYAFLYWIWTGLLIPNKLQSSMVTTHTYAQNQGQKSAGSKDRVVKWTDRRTDKHKWSHYFPH